MGRASFVGWLFAMAIASLVIAVGDKSWGWLAGAGVFLAVALFARRRLSEERDDGEQGTASWRFVGAGILLMLACMGFLFWLQTSA